MGDSSGGDARYQFLCISNFGNLINYEFLIKLIRRKLYRAVFFFEGDVLLVDIGVELARHRKFVANF